MNTQSNLLELLLDSWDRNNTILVNLLHALPDGSLELRATPDSMNLAELFIHMHYCRMIFVKEDAPEYAREIHFAEWKKERDINRIAQMLRESAAVVREAVAGKLARGEQMDLHYDNPILFLQHMIWHEGYHHGQIKLIVKAAGKPFDDEEIGPLTWDIWMSKAPQ